MKTRRTEPTFCTNIGPGAAYALVIAAPVPIAQLGHRAVAFITGCHANGYLSEVAKEHAEFISSGTGTGVLGPGIFDIRWIDEEDTKVFIESDEDDGINLCMISPWGIFEPPQKDEGYCNIAIYLRRAPSEEEMLVLMARATRFFTRCDIRDIHFRVVRQTMTLDTVYPKVDPTVA